MKANGWLRYALKKHCPRFRCYDSIPSHGNFCQLYFAPNRTTAKTRSISKPRRRTSRKQCREFVETITLREIIAEWNDEWNDSTTTMTTPPPLSPSIPNTFYLGQSVLLNNFHTENILHQTIFTLHHIFASKNMCRKQWFFPTLVQNNSIYPKTTTYWSSSSALVFSFGVALFDRPSSAFVQTLYIQQRDVFSRMYSSTSGLTPPPKKKKNTANTTHLKKPPQHQHKKPPRRW